MYNNYFVIYLTPTQYCKSTVPQLKTTKKQQHGESKPNLNSNKKKKRQEINAYQDVEKSEHLYTVVDNINWHSTMKNSMEVSQEIKNRTTI